MPINPIALNNGCSKVFPVSYERFSHTKQYIVELLLCENLCSRILLQLSSVALHMNS